MVQLGSEIEAAAREVELARQELQAAYRSATQLLRSLDDTLVVLEKGVQQQPLRLRLPGHWREIPGWTKLVALPWIRELWHRRTGRILR